MYELGCTDRVMVCDIQDALNIPIDGIFGPKTKSAVMRFQRDHYIVADGIVGPKTLNILGILDTDVTDFVKTQNNLLINKHFLPKGEYLEDDQPIQNDYFFLHHTAGWNNPFRCIDHWGRDNRGAIATEFVIGGQNIKTGDATYDGDVVQAFPEGCQGWHLGKTGSVYMQKHSVGVELCNFGYLTEDLKTYVGVKAKESQVATLKEPFKNYTKWHRYSDEQILSLKRLILHVADRDTIDIHKGLIHTLKTGSVADAFSFNEDAYNGKVKGLLLHCNVRKYKVDLFPQDELIDMLLTL